MQVIAYLETIMISFSMTDNVIKLKSKNEAFRDYVEEHHNEILLYQNVQSNHSDYDYLIMKVVKRPHKTFIELLDAFSVNGSFITNVRGFNSFMDFDSAMESFENITGKRFTPEFKSFIKQKYDNLINQ